MEKLLAEGSELGAHVEARAALEEMRILFGFLQDMGALGPCVFDLSLARGLDYYTGVIYEAVLQGANLGSIAGGACWRPLRRGGSGWGGWVGWRGFCRGQPGSHRHGWVLAP